MCKDAKHYWYYRNGGGQQQTRQQCHCYDGQWTCFGAHCGIVAYTSHLELNIITLVLKQACKCHKQMKSVG